MENTIIDALNALVTKMGGNSKDNLMIIDALNDIVDNYSSGGGGSSGGDIVYVPVSVDITDPDNPVVTCETSVDTILGYFAEGKLVYLKYTYNVVDGNYLLFSPTYVETVSKNIQWATMQPGNPFFITGIYTSGTEWGYNEFIMQLVQG